MCLITDQLKPRRIKENLLVFKMLKMDVDKKLYSPFLMYSSCQWTESVVKETSLVFVKSIIKECIFADTMSLDYYYAKYANSLYETKITEVSRGFSACISKARAKMLLGCENWVIKECIIPEGSEIFTDETELIISNKMMLL